MHESIKKLLSIFFYGRTEVHGERRLKENNRFRQIIGDCIDVTEDIEDLTDDVYRWKRFKTNHTEVRN